MEDGVEGNEGFLMTKEMFSYTEVSAAVQAIPIQRDYPLRQMLIQALKTGYNPISSVSHLKFTCDADKYIPYDIDMLHLLQENVREYGPFFQTLRKRITGAANIYADLWYLLKGFLTMGTTLHTATVLTYAGETMGVEDVLQGATDAVSTAETLADCEAMGYAPHSCALLPLGRRDTPGDWLDLSKFGDIKLFLTGGAAAGLVNVVTQQLRK